MMHPNMDYHLQGNDDAVPTQTPVMNPQTVAYLETIRCERELEEAETRRRQKQRYRTEMTARLVYPIVMISLFCWFMFAFMAIVTLPMAFIIYAPTTETTSSLRWTFAIVLYVPAVLLTILTHYMWAAHKEGNSCKAGCLSVPSILAFFFVCGHGFGFHCKMNNSSGNNVCYEGTSSHGLSY